RYKLRNREGESGDRKRRCRPTCSDEEEREQSIGDGLMVVDCLAISPVGAPASMAKRMWEFVTQLFGMEWEEVLAV
ncbi:hypothetical protein M8C21_006724, partial [Ambrosia artemisiifolia]